MSEAPGTSSALDVARRRETPRFFVVDADLRVVFQTAAHANADDHLPQAVKAVARRLMHDLSAEQASVIGILSPSEVVRLVRLEAEDGVEHYAVLVERFAARNSVAKAAERYRLSPREAEVLDGLMRGESTNDIARRLGIAATTIQEHIRKIGHKTNVTKRSAIVATVFGLG